MFSPRSHLIPSVPRLIAHLDMDAFFASVELLRYPELRGRPVVVGGGRRHQPEAVHDPVTGAVTRRFSTLRGYVGRGVITTATYEARVFGLHSALGLMKAAQMAPDAILLPSDFDAYRHYSRRFKAAVREIAPQVEDRGIDEIYIDLSDVRLGDSDGAARSAAAADGATSAVPRDGDDNGDGDAYGDGDGQLRYESEIDAWWRARDVARAIKAAVRTATGLSCSIAVAPNKLLAKIASELDKPDGLTLLKPADIATRIWPLPARRINGIGPKASAKLEALDIHTIGELAQAEPAWLVTHFGANYGAWLHQVAHGRDDREVVTYSEPKSISRETTFERDLHARRDRDELSRIFTDLCMRLGDDLQRKGYAGKTIGIKMRFDNFRTVTRDQTIEVPTQDARAIRRAAGECLKRVPLERRIRLLGVRMGALVSVGGLAAHPGAAEPSTSLFD
jgi:DNA polymerase-4